MRASLLASSDKSDFISSCLPLFLQPFIQCCHNIQTPPPSTWSLHYSVIDIHFGKIFTPLHLLFSCIWPSHPINLGCILFLKCSLWDKYTSGPPAGDQFGTSTLRGLRQVTSLGPIHSETNTLRSSAARFARVLASLAASDRFAAFGFKNARGI